jgi:hypothetical protein
MESLKYTGLIPCHEGMPIHGICLDCNGAAFCMTCLLTDHISHENLLTIPALVNEAHQYYIQLQTAKQALRTDFNEVWNGKDESLTNLNAHIEQEKLKVTEVFAECQKMVLEKFQAIMGSILKDLDSQVGIVKNNWDFYEEKCNSFNGGENAKNEVKSVSDILRDLSAICDKTQLQKELNQLRMDASKRDADENLDSLKSQLIFLGLKIKETPSLKPSVSKALESVKATTNDIIQNILAKLSTEQRFCFPSHSLIKSLDIHPRMASNIVKSIADEEKLMSWLPTKPSKLSLLYRGSRDGFTGTAFHSKADNNQNTIVLVEATTGKIFGGFSDVTWNETNDYNPSSNCFIFSVTDGEKYLNHTSEYATGCCCSSRHYIAFGGGHDFCLVDGCNDNPSSFSNFGHSYDSRNMKRDSLTGSENSFTVREVEVYSLD